MGSAAEYCKWLNNKFDLLSFVWRRDPESNWANRICNPGHNRFAIAPYRQKKPIVEKIMGKQKSFPNKFGAGKEARTLDLYLGKVSLYQLSYSRKKRSPHYSDIPKHVNKNTKKKLTGFHSVTIPVIVVSDYRSITYAFQQMLLTA